MTDEQLRSLASRLTRMEGMVGVTLGGSRARGDHSPSSDFDLGLYYRPTLDVPGLRDLAREVAGESASLTEVGAWGPWVDGGGWLNVGGSAVDWIYRDLGRVQRAWLDARDGQFYFHGQVGHPLGVPDFAYPGEVAVGVILADPSGELARLQEETSHYPPQLADALVRRLDEAFWMTAVARKAISRADATYVAGCVFRVVGLCAHALHGRARRWLINEKGAVTAAARLEIAPADFEHRAHGLLAHIGATETDLSLSLDAAAGLVADTADACDHRLSAF